MAAIPQMPSKFVEIVLSAVIDEASQMRPEDAFGAIAPSTGAQVPFSRVTVTCRCLPPFCPPAVLYPPVPAGLVTCTLPAAFTVVLAVGSVSAR